MAYSLEGKSTRDGVSVYNNGGANIAPDGRADLRVVGNQDRNLTVYWQLPNPDPEAQADDWTLYDGEGNLPGPAPTYGADVYVGLITYAAGQAGIPFVGTCDTFQGSEQSP